MILNVIVIDDSPLQLLHAVKYVERHENLRLLGAYANPLLGLLAIESAAVDLILLDVEMPEMTGFELKSHLSRDTAVVMNSSEPRFKEVAMGTGAFDFLSKPLKFDAFESTIDRLIQHRFSVPVPHFVRAIAS
ncbi:LytR/AlgR family response regulator transcription factor [Maribacter sp. 2-571]|uniref:LytR/AlgR family response regulator transcription factor n=1 Tax=Maribacter sp. 2-571 TaxID=3417569 RepID=UPI003D3577B7